MADIARKVQELQREEEFRRKLEEIRNGAEYKCGKGKS